MNQPQQRANGETRMSDSDTNKPQAETTDAPRLADAATDREDGKAARTRRRRFRRAAPTSVEGLGAAETLASLRAELVLLREENASLKAAQHQVPDLGRVLKRARSVPGEHRDRDDVADEATQLLVEGLTLTCFGIAGALAVTAVGAQVIRRWLIGEGAFSGSVVDGRVLAFTIVAGVLTGVAASKERRER